MFLLLWRPPFDDVRGSDYEPPLRGIEQERQVRMRFALRSGPIEFMASEERFQFLIASAFLLNSRYHGAAHRPRQIARLRVRSKSGLNRKRMESLCLLSDRRHHAEAQKAAVTDHQWPCDRFIETDLDMPEPLFCETGA